MMLLLSRQARPEGARGASRDHVAFDDIAGAGRHEDRILARGHHGRLRGAEHAAAVLEDQQEQEGGLGKHDAAIRYT